MTIQGLPLDTWLPPCCPQRRCFSRGLYRTVEGPFHPGLHVKVTEVMGNALKFDVLYAYDRRYNYLVPYFGVEDIGNCSVQQVYDFYTSGRAQYRQTLTIEDVRKVVEKGWGWMIEVIERPETVKQTWEITDEKIATLFQQCKQEEFLAAIQQQLIPLLDQSAPVIHHSEFNGVIRSFF